MCITLPGACPNYLVLFHKLSIVRYITLYAYVLQLFPLRFANPNVTPPRRERGTWNPALPPTPEPPPSPTGVLERTIIFSGGGAGSPGTFGGPSPTFRCVRTQEPRRLLTKFKIGSWRVQGNHMHNSNC